MGGIGIWQSHNKQPKPVGMLGILNSSIEPKQVPVLEAQIPGAFEPGSAASTVIQAGGKNANPHEAKTHSANYAVKKGYCIYVLAVKPTFIQTRLAVLDTFPSLKEE